MVRLSANLSFLFHDRPFLERFGAAARAGFRAVEFLFPYDYPVAALGSLTREHRLAVSVFNAEPGNWAAGSRGHAALPGRERALRESIERALPYAAALGAKRLHVMAGVPSGDLRCDEDCYVENIRWAANRLAQHDLRLLVEPINSRDMPGYFLATTDQAVRLIDRIGEDNVDLQFDIYHQQVSQGDVETHMRRYINAIGHVQIAGVPHRHEPDENNELNYQYLLMLLDSLGYEGWVGCEYRPRGDTVMGLGWMAGLTAKSPHLIDERE